MLAYATRRNCAATQYSAAAAGSGTASRKLGVAVEHLGRVAAETEVNGPAETPLTRTFVPIRRRRIRVPSCQASGV